MPLALDKEIRPREAEWAEIRAQHGLASGTLKEFVGLSFEYADYTMGYGRDKPGPPAHRLDHQADAGGLPRGDGQPRRCSGKAFAEMQAKRLLPPPR